MLQELREKAQGWIAWTIIGLIALTFALYGASSIFTGEQDPVVAKVGSEKITQRELENSYQRLINQQNNPALQELDPKEVKQKLLQSLIDEAILLQAESKMGMTVNPEQINTTLYTIPFLQESGQFSQSAYVRFLENSRFSDPEFRSLLREYLLKRQLDQGILQTAFSLKNEIDLASQFVFQERDYRTVTFKQEDFNDKVALSDDKIKAYYDAHHADFMSEEQVALEYVILSVADLEKEINPTEKQLNDFYNSHKDQFSDPAKAHVKHILLELAPDADEAKVKEVKTQADNIVAEIKKGASFEALAKKHSTDPKTAAKGGELSWITKGELSPEFEKVAFTLKPNEVSEPVRTEFGFQIIKLLAKEPEKVRPFAAVKEEVAQKYKNQMAQEKFYQMVDEISVIAYEQPDSLQPIVDKFQLPIKKTEYFSQQNVPALPELQNSQVIAAAFSQSLKEDKNNSELIPLNEQSYIVLRDREYRPSALKPFAEVKAVAKERLLREKTQALAKEHAEKLVADIKAGKDVANIKWQTFTGIARANKDLDPLVLDAVFELPKPQNPKEQVADLKRLATGDYAVVWLSKIKDGEKDKLSIADKEAYAKSMANLLGELEFALYTSSLAKEIKVKKYLDKI